MSLNPTDYSRRFAELPIRTVIADEKGQILGFDDGFKRLTELVRAGSARKGKLIFFGDSPSAGLAGMLSNSFSAVCPTISLNDTVRLSAVNELSDLQQLYARQVKLIVTPADVMMVLSVNGRAPLLLNGVISALDVGCTIVTFTGDAPDNPLITAGSLNLYVPARSAGFISIVHHIILQCVLDSLMENGN